MKKLLSSAGVKAAAVLLCLISGILTAACILTTLVMLRGFSPEGNSITKENLQESAYWIAGQTYAAMLLSAYSENPAADAPDRLEDVNMEYAVAGSVSGDFDKLDLTDDSIYLYRSEGYNGYDQTMMGGRHWFYSFRSDNFLQAWRTHTSAYNMGNENEGWNVEVKDKSLIPLKYFWVLYRVKDPLVENNDLFVQGRDIAEIIWTVYQWLVPMTVLSMVLFLLSLGFLIAAAGRQKGSEEIRIRWTDRLPFLILTGAIGGMVVLGLSAGYIFARNIGYTAFRFIVLWAILDGIFMGLLLILYVMSIAVRVKSGTFWQRTILYHIVKAGRKTFSTAAENVPLMWKCGGILAILTLMEWIVIAWTEYDNSLEMTALLIYKLFEIPVVFAAVLQFDRIDRRTRSMAAGDLHTPIETKGMYGAFKKHAEDINHIQSGMNTAVEERMKSERLKTELITNVSHDIKTPLTSIINYTDLLAKEEPESPAIREYVEVLSRQSERLKKLIQDLIEASKASTGSLELTWEDCDVSVILAQAAAEFEDKLQQKDLTLKVTQPEKRIVIRADGRYLWRVFENLLSNIGKYAMEGTRVYIDVTCDQQEVYIDFKNISRDPLNISGDELLERFVRGDTSRSTEGSGLGLSIADSLVTLMGGRMKLEIDGDLFKVKLQFPIKETAATSAPEADASDAS